MNYLDILILTAVLASNLVARRETLAHPPAEMLQNIDLFDDLPLIESSTEAP